MINILIIVIGAVILVSAILAVLLKNILASVITAGAVSLFASVIYIFLASPDVAMTEAAIGSGLTTIVFLYAIARIKKEDLNDQ